MAKSDDGAIAVAKALHENKRVSNVNLNSNCISFTGAKSFASLLSLSTTSLMHLDLSKNEIGSNGGVFNL